MFGSIKYLRSIVLYARVFGKERRTLGTILEQLVLLRLRVSNNFRVRGEYRDDGFSGKRFSRPAFEEMLEYIRSQKKDRIRYIGVVNWRVLNTDRKEYKRILKVLKTLGIKVICLSFKEKILLKQQI